MKIGAIVTYVTRNAGGMFESVRHLYQEMEKIPETSVTICGVKDQFITEDLPSWSPLPVHVFNVWGPRQFQYAPGMSRYLQMTKDFDLLHTHGLWTYTSAAVAAWQIKYRRPYLISPHGMLDPWAVRNSWWKKQLALAFYERQHLRNAGCIRALCASEAKSIREFGLKNPVCVIPNGIDLNAVEQSLKVKREASPFGPFARGRNVLLYLGRIHPKKGLVNLLQGWKKVLSASPSASGSWVLAITGWDQGRHEHHLKELSREAGLENSVCFLGPMFGPEKAACYQACDAFVLPSFSEGLPMVILEAWAYGKPVLMSPECNLPEGFAGQAAFRAETNATSIGEGLELLFGLTARERQEMGLRGLDLVRERFTWPKVALELRQVSDWLLGGGTRPASVEE